MSASEQAQSEGARAATRAKEARAAAAVQTGATWEEACDAVLAALDLDTKPDLALAFIDSPCWSACAPAPARGGWPGRAGWA